MSPSPPMKPNRRHCPRCGSDRVTGHKYGEQRPSLYDFYCANCQLIEERTGDAADFAAWQSRWVEAGPPLHIHMTPEEWRAHIEKVLKKK